LKEVTGFLKAEVFDYDYDDDNNNNVILNYLNKPYFLRSTQIYFVVGLINLISVFVIVNMGFAFIVQLNLPTTSVGELSYGKYIAFLSDDVTHSELVGMSTERLHLYCKNDVAGIAVGIPRHTVQRMPI
jgi:hypothetical protein